MKRPVHSACGRSVECRILVACFLLSLGFHCDSAELAPAEVPATTTTNKHQPGNPSAIAATNLQPDRLPEPFGVVKAKAERGDATAQYTLGLIYREGKEVAKDAVKAAKWYRMAAEQGQSDAQVSLGTLYLNGEGVLVDYPEALKWFRVAADSGEPLAQAKLGAMYEFGTGVPADPQEAIKWYRKAAERGEPFAQWSLARAYEQGDGVAKDLAEATKWYRKAAEQGNASAQVSLALIYDQGQGVEKNYAEAAKWYRKAAEQGNVSAQAFLGGLFLLGKGVPLNYSEALKWLRAAAESADDTAQFLVGSMYEEGHGVPLNYAEALKWYRKAAEQGNATAQYTLGVMCREGRGVIKDTVEAAKWYRMAAEQGQLEAQGSLGTIYLIGEGVPIDYPEALKWFRRAAESGDPFAQSKLASMYSDGHGVPQNDREAASWWRRAAEQGRPVDQYFVGFMYYFGKGVPIDFVESYKWLNLAAANGETNAANLRALVAKHMSPEQVAEAQRRSSIFVPRRATSAESSRESAETLERLPKANGSGFFITADGYLLTCFHVIDGASRVLVKTAKGELPATLVKADAANDIAVLKAAGTFSALPLAPSRNVKLGEAVFTIGFPNTVLQGIEPKLTRGEISGLAGVEDDPRQFQISVAVQPGNSGGPLINQFGNVVGIVTGRLSDLATLKATGSLPQNVNYAVKSAYATILLDSLPEASSKLIEPTPARDRKFEEVVKDAQAATALLLAY